MRTLALALIALTMLGLAARATSAVAAEHAPAHAMVLQAPQATPVPPHDDTRVGVQIGVVVAAVVTVVFVGTAAYFIRKRLGLVAGPPEQPTGGHH
jgi:hypothetical protein